MVLLAYGRNAIKRNGLYDQLLQILHSEGKTVVELAGIKSNPTIAQVREGCRLVRENNVDLILAVGGGSVVDCCKTIGASAYASEEPWTYYWQHRNPLPDHIVPVGVVLTMAGTASEMNAGAVITNEELRIKAGYHFPMELCCPRFSILNPEFTYSVPRNQMVSGIFDIFSHLMEQYFSGSDDCTSDYLLEGNMLALIASARKALQDPFDYEARSNIMWCATMGLNQILAVSKTQDWEVHQMEHQIGAYCDCPHGIGLAVVSIPYYRLIYRYGLPKFVRYAKNIWHVNPEDKTDDQIALEGIQRLSDFIDELGIPRHLRDLGVNESQLPEIAASVRKIGGYHVPTTEEVLHIFQQCY